MNILWSFPTLDLKFQIWPHRSKSATECYSELSKKLPEYLQYSVMNLAWKNKREGMASDTHKVSNVCLANMDFTVKAKKKGWGGGICWNSMSLDSIWTICSSRLGHILMIKLLILSSILSATQYFHDLLLADLTHYLFGLYHSHDKRLQLQPWSLTRRFGARLLRCRGRWRRRVQRSTDRKHFWMWSPLTPRQRGLEQVTSSPCASVFLSTKWV